MTFLAKWIVRPVSAVLRWASWSGGISTSRLFVTGWTTSHFRRSQILVLASCRKQNTWKPSGSETIPALELRAREISRRALSLDLGTAAERRLFRNLMRLGEEKFAQAIEQLCEETYNGQPLLSWAGAVQAFASSMKGFGRALVADRREKSLPRRRGPRGHHRPLRPGFLPEPNHNAGAAAALTVRL